MRGQIASFLLKGTHVIAGRIEPSVNKQVTKIAQVTLMQEFAHPDTETLGHDKPRPTEIPN